MNGCRILQVEKVAGGQVPPDQDIRLFAELILSDTEESCCKAQKNRLSRRRSESGGRPGKQIRGTAAGETAADRRHAFFEFALAHDARGSNRSLIALGIHWLCRQDRAAGGNAFLFVFLWNVLGVSLCPRRSHSGFGRVARWMRHMCPIFADRHLTVCRLGNHYARVFGCCRCRIFPGRPVSCKV